MLFPALRLEKVAQDILLVFSGAASLLFAFLCALGELRGEQKKIRKTYQQL
jgi:hypothetical protein